MSSLQPSHTSSTSHTLTNTLTNSTILVVDDNVTNLEVLHHALSQQGYNVRVEVDGHQAIAQVRSAPPDLLLLDVMLPTVNGFDICQQLKADPQTQDIPIIFMTALTNTDDKLMGLNLGAVDYITKPFQQEELLARVRLQLQIRHLTKTLELRNQQLQQEVEERQQAERALQQLNQDLEARVEARTQDLRQSQDYLRQLTENIDNVFWMTDPGKQQIIYVSPAYDRIWGYSRQTLLHDPYQWIAAIHPDDRERVVAAFPKQAHGDYNEEYRIIRSDGSVRWIRDRAFPIVDEAGHPFRIAGIAEDITAQRQIEETLRLQERAIAASSNGIVITDARQPDQPVIFVNPAFEQITGYAASEVLGRNCRFLQGDDSDQPGIQDLRIALDSGQSCRVNLRNYRRDGSLFWNQLSVSPIYDDHGTLTHYIGIQTDVSERMQTEARLKASLTEKEILLKEIHHRVKNNLLVVSSLLEWQRDSVDDPQFVSMIAESQSRVQSIALVHEKLYASEDLAQINLGDYLDTLIHQLTVSFNLNPDIAVSLNLDPIFLNVETVTPCGLIINELVSNVFKHAFPDGRSGHLWITAQQVEQQVMITIQDDGVGLPDGFDITAAESMGSQLVCLLTKQLAGKISVCSDRAIAPGTTLTLTFSELHYQQRF